MNNTQSNVTVQNNLFQGCVTFMTSWGNVSYAPGGLNYNAYSQCNSANCWFWNTQFYGDFASWKSASVGDANGNFSTTGANLDANYKPQSGSIAIDTGVNLAHLGIVALNNDAANLPRPALAGGAWTTGAYSAGQSPAINPPSNLTVLSVN
jgi:hypothetical protein